MLLDKPSGITSARAVARVKHLLPKGTRIGHTGTLDPLASGLLVLLTGRATRLSRYVTGLNKAYTVTARFGAVSDTLDADGEITPLENATPMPNETALRAATKRFTGVLRQTPPMASAVKVKGERLYRAHRRGETVERESRPATVHALQLLSLDQDENTATFAVSCGSGTYVRTLLSDLADSLDTGAYLTALRRTRVGHLKVEDAIPPDELAQVPFDRRIIQPREAVLHLTAARIGPDLRRVVCSGRKMTDAFGGAGAASGDEAFRVELGDELLAIYRAEDGGGARAEVVLCDP